MPSIVFWAGVGGGTEQYRCLTPGAALRRLGWDVAHVGTDVLPDETDVLVVQRVLHPGTPELIRDARKAGTVVVYDIDDWYDGLPDYNPASATVTASDIAVLHECLRAADVVTVSTDELADGYGHLNRTVVLPNYLDPDIWTGNERYRKPRVDVHVGWLGSAKWRNADVEILKPWLADWLDRTPGVRFVAAGSDSSLFDHLGVGGLVCPAADDHIRPYEHLPAMLAWFDIGLVPLTFNRFNQAKSWCKGMEYNAAGVAAVASPSREYRKYIDPGVNGYLARDWPKTLRRTLDDLDTLRDGARRTAERYMVDRHVDQWVQTYESCRAYA